MACRHRPEQELAVAGPQVAVAPGATAGTPLSGSGFRVGEHRGHVEAATGVWQGPVVSTSHAPAVLCAPGEEARHRAYAGFARDLTSAGRAAANAQAS